MRHFDLLTHAPPCSLRHKENLNTLISLIFILKIDQSDKVGNPFAKMYTENMRALCVNQTKKK